MKSVIRAVALLGGIIFLEAELAGAQTIKYLEFPPAIKQGDLLRLPLTLTLPCYGEVQVTATTSMPSPTYFEQMAAYNQSAPPSTFSWGTDANRFNVVTTDDTDYTITFTFLGSPPVASQLFLAVVGLATKTTATVPAGALLGEFHLPGTSTTTLTQTGTKLGSEGGGDPFNTGWALYQPTASSNSLSVAMHQQGGDGVGWTLGYLCGSAPPAVDPCCPPWNSGMLADMLFYKGSGSIAAPYTLQFQPTDAFEAQIQAYLNYLNILNPAINSIVIHFRLNDAGTGSVPISGPMVGFNHFVAWGAGGGGVPINGPIEFFTLQNEPMQVNRWYRVHTGIFLNDNEQFFPAQCASNHVDVRIQVQGGPGSAGLVLQIRTPDGRIVEKALTIAATAG